MTMAHRLAARMDAYSRREGAFVTLTINAESYNPATRTRTNTPTSYQCSALFGRRMLANIDGALVKTDEQQVSLSGLQLPSGVAPTTTSQITRGGKVYQVTDVEPVSPDGSTIVSWNLLVKVNP